MTTPCIVCRYGKAFADHNNVIVTCTCPDRDHCESCDHDDVPKLVKIVKKE